MLNFIQKTPVELDRVASLVREPPRGNSRPKKIHPVAKIQHPYTGITFELIKQFLDSFHRLFNL